MRTLTLHTSLVVVVGGLVSLAAALPTSIQDEEVDPSEVARRYVELYGAGELEELSTLMADTIVMEDRTAAIMGPALRIEGREKLIATLTPMFAAVRDKSLVVEKQFVSGNFALTWGRFTYTAPIPSGDVTLEMDIVIVLELAQGKVVHHSDYADYATAMRQVAEASKDR